MPITTDVAHQAAFGELRIHTIQLFLPIGDDVSRPAIIDALQDYIDGLMDDKVGNSAHETFVADNGVVIHADHAFPLVDYNESIRLQRG